MRLHRYCRYQSTVIVSIGMVAWFTMACLAGPRAAAAQRAEPRQTSFAELQWESGEGALDQASFGNLLRRRQTVATIHKTLGIATWLAMTTTVVLGGIQYHNLYGTFSALEDTPCAQGNAIFGQGQCTGTPWPHLIAALTTTVLYTTTFTASLAMPDPTEILGGDAEESPELSLHKALRWVHLLGMIAQLTLGAIIANGDSFGLERESDFRTLQALATVHLGLGAVTWSALTIAGGLMVF